VQLLDGADLTAAVAAAHASDLAIVMVGDAQTEGKDHNLALTGNQDALVAGVVAANPRTVVVVKSGGPVLMPWAESVPAILEAWYPGEEDGNAVAAVLLGDQNPSGRLPITFPKSLEDLPAHTPEQYPGTGPAKQTTEHYSEGVFVGYRWYDAKNLTPQFAFGYGLSYTTFGYDQLRLSSDSLAASNPSLTVAFQVRNLGRRAGAAVPQVYVGIPAQPGVDQPPRQLKGFARVGVEPGATANVEVKLDARAFSYWDVATHTWKVPAGDFHVYVGESSRDLRLQGKVTVR
jgi:beta-glucosidase